MLELAQARKRLRKGVGAYRVKDDGKKGNSS